jgi:hypothetical protein
MRRLLLVVALGVVSGCPSPKPEPTPSPSPTPAQTCACVVPDSEDPAWQKLLPAPAPYYGSAVAAAKAVIGNPCGEQPILTLDRVAVALVAANVCAARSTDSVFLRRPDDRTYFEEWHLVTYSANEFGCWADFEPYKGAWRYAGTIPQLASCN